MNKNYIKQVDDRFYISFKNEYFTSFLSHNSSLFSTIMSKLNINFDDNFYTFELERIDNIEKKLSITNTYYYEKLLFEKFNDFNKKPYLYYIGNSADGKIGILFFPDYWQCEDFLENDYDFFEANAEVNNIRDLKKYFMEKSIGDVGGVLFAIKL